MALDQDCSGGSGVEKQNKNKPCTIWNIIKHVYLHVKLRTAVSGWPLADELF